MYYLCLFSHLLSLPICPLYFSNSSLSLLLIPANWPHAFFLTSYLPSPPSLPFLRVCVLCHDPHLLLHTFIPLLSTFFALQLYSFTSHTFLHNTFLFLPSPFSVSFTPTVSATACVTPTWCSSFTTQTPSSSWPSPSFCSTPTCTVPTSSPTAKCCWRTSYAI